MEKEGNIPMQQYKTQIHAIGKDDREPHAEVSIYYWYVGEKGRKKWSKQKIFWATCMNLNGEKNK